MRVGAFRYVGVLCCLVGALALDACGGGDGGGGGTGPGGGSGAGGGPSTPPAPTLSVSREAVAFTARPPVQSFQENVTLTTTSTEPVVYAVDLAPGAPPAPWLNKSVQPLNASTVVALSLANPFQPQGSGATTLRVSMLRASDHALLATHDVTVSYQLGELVTVTPDQLLVSYHTGSLNNVLSRTFRVDVPTLAWTATVNVPWLAIDRSSGNGTTTITVTVDPTGMPVGVNNGAVTVLPSDGQVRSVSVQLFVDVPVLLVQPATLAFQTNVAGTAPAQLLQVSDGYGSSGTFRATTTATWLQVTPASSNLGDFTTVSLTTQASTLAAGTYSTTVDVSNTTAGLVQTQSVPVTLTISP